MSDSSIACKDDVTAFPTAVIELDQNTCDAAQQNYFNQNQNNKNKNKNNQKKKSKLRKVVYYYDSSSSDNEDEPVEAVGVLVTPDSEESTNNKNKTNNKNNKNNKKYASPREPMDPEDDQYSNNNNKSDECPLIRIRNNKNNNNNNINFPTVITIRKEKEEPISIHNPRIGSPTPIGFFAFGLTTALFNVHNAKICQLNTATMGQVIFFGGLTQFLCGFFELINKNTFGCTISSTYGAFWLATAALYMIDVQGNNQTMVMGDHTYSGGFFLFWFFFAGTLFFCSLFAPLMCTLLMFLVPVNFLLQSISFFANSTTVMKVAGYEGIVVGCLAFYLGMAFTFEDVYQRRILPLFSHDRQYRNWKW